MKRGAVLARNKELNQKIRDERKAQIMSSALELFAKKGLSATKISDISRSSGISHGLMYHYFRSKEEIFIELIRYAFERVNAACRYIEGLPDTPREKIKMAVKGLLRNLVENEDSSLYYLLIAQTTTMESIPEEAKRIIESERREPYETMVRIIRQGQRDGSIKDCHDASDLALVFWTSIKGLAINRAIDGKNFRMPDPEILMGMFARETEG